jgi:predicted nuclease of predicted toxin-antitoxin system
VRFLVDACTDARLVAHLRLLGHDVTRVGQDYPGDLEDTAILDIARNERRVLITDDRDFGELVFRSRHSHFGVIYLRLPTVDISMRCARLDAVIAAYADRLDNFLVVDLTEIRVRTRTSTRQ